MRNDFDLPAGLFDPKPGHGANPDELDPPPRTSRRYHHLRSLAENGDLEDAFENIDTLAFLRLCMLRLAEKGDWKEAARIAKDMLPYQHQRRPNVNVVRHESVVAVPPTPPAPEPAGPRPTPPAPELPPGAPDTSDPDTGGPNPPAPDAPGPQARAEPRPHGDDPPRTLVDARRQAAAHDRAEQRQWVNEARWNLVMQRFRERHRRALEWHLHADPTTFLPLPANDSVPERVARKRRRPRR